MNFLMFRKVLLISGENMKTDDIQKVIDTAKENYETSEPWPDDDIWHTFSYKILHSKVQNYLDSLQLKNTQVVLNAGCGKTTYKTDATIVYMDIIKEYVDLFDNYLVASIEDIPLSENSVDCIICVGSVINYADIQKALSEFSRILKPDGILILEYERTNSAEFLCTKKHSKTLFMQTYQYNNQTHYLWMYNEKFVLQLAEYYKFICEDKYRFHCMSSLLFRLGIPEKKAAKYSRFDKFLQPFSYSIAHNEILILKKCAL